MRGRKRAGQNFQKGGREFQIGLIGVKIGELRRGFVEKFDLRPLKASWRKAIVRATKKGATYVTPA